MAGIAVEQPFCAEEGEKGSELDDLQDAVSRGADHVSLVEEEPPAVEAARWVDRYQAARALLERCGLERYEIAHFARPGRRSPHVERIFAFGEVIGLGPGAVSRVGLQRQRNSPDTDAYVGALRRGESPVDFRETLTPADVAGEKISLGIRLAKGVDIERICHDLPQSAREPIEASARALAGAGWLERVGKRVRLTERGILLADKIAAGLLP
jgi:oxygen-independent coproporphyrinogen-3 oxidase